MSCETVREELVALLDGELDDAAAEARALALETHPALGDPLGAERFQRGEAGPFGRTDLVQPPLQGRPPGRPPRLRDDGLQDRQQVAPLVVHSFSSRRAGVHRRPGSVEMPRADRSRMESFGIDLLCLKGFGADSRAQSFPTGPDPL